MQIGHGCLVPQDQDLGREFLICIPVLKQYRKIWDHRHLKSQIRSGKPWLQGASQLYTGFFTASTFPENAFSYFFANTSADGLLPAAANPATGCHCPVNGGNIFSPE